MGLYTTYSTDADREQEGVDFEYGGAAKLRIARAGGSNTRFQKAVERITKPHRRAIERGSVPANVMREMYIEALCESCLLDWHTKMRDPETGDETWVKGIESPSGDGVVDFTKENAVALFKKLPDFFDEVQADANAYSSFQSAETEADSGN